MSFPLTSKFTVVGLVLILGSLSLEPIATRALPGRSFSSPSDQSIMVSAGYFIPIEIESFSNAGLIDYAAQSNITVTTALMDSQQFDQFNNSGSDISNSLSHYTGTSVAQNVSVSSGAYYLVFFNSANSGSANVTFSYRADPHTPFEAGPRLPPQPTGLASFGILNESGNAVPYAIRTSSVVGAANISSIEAYNASAASFNDTVSGATLQLNSMLVVRDNNSQFVYWAQATPDFVTNANQVSYADNLWNVTDQRGFLSNQTVTSSNGNFVFPAGPNSTSQYYYGFQSSNLTYVEPLDLRVLMNESLLQGTGVLLQVGFQILANGSQLTPERVDWFDNITIHDAGASSAYFYVAGNDSTPIGSYYDTEFVFGGEGNLEATQFTQMNSTLGLFYLNESSGRLSAFPSYYSFGGDTGEATYNLHVAYSGNGIAQVTQGTPDYVYLSAAPGTTNSSTSSSISPSQSLTATSSDVVSQGATSSTNFSSSAFQVSSSTDAGSAGSIFSVDYLLIPVIVGLAIAVGGIVRERKKKS